MSSLPELLAAELERPREVSAQVVKHLCGTYGVVRDAIGAFLATELAGLEDYEIDLALASLFTPTLHDQAVFAELLGRDSVPADQWPALIQQLVARPTRGHLITEDGQAHSVPLRAVTIERYVHRLCLDATIPESLVKLIAHLLPAADRPLLTAVARRAIWESEPRRQILVRYLTAAGTGDAYRLGDVVELLKLAENYEPAGVDELLVRIPYWQQVLSQQIDEAGSPKPFFNDRIEEMHGGGRDQRQQDEGRISAKRDEHALLERLRQVLSG